MTNRERIIRTVLCQRVDRLPVLCDFGPWYETLQRWTTEGLEDPADWDKPLQLDEGIYKLNFVNLLFDPWFEKKVIRKTEDKIVRINHLGVTEEVFKDHSSLAKQLDFPVKTAEDWERIKKERMNPDSFTRFPSDFAEKIRQAKAADKVIRIGKYPYGLFGTIRELMGVEEFLCAFYTDPDLIHVMMNDLTDLWLAVYEKVLRYIQIDWIHIWEDMSGTNGSLISPKAVEKFMLPNYRRIADFAKQHNIPIFSVDTDGDCSELLPLFQKAGVNMVFPFEVKAGNDVVKIKAQYPNLCLMGGIDKSQLTMGTKEIDRELDRVAPLFHQTGYIPMLDHGAPPDIPYQNFIYFYQQIRKRVQKEQG